MSDGTHALKVVFETVGEIDFIVAPGLTSRPTSITEVSGRSIALETPAEIIAKKIVYRGRSMQPRDMFDIACVREFFGDDYLLDALAPFKSECSAAAQAAERMDKRFAEELMRKLLYRNRFAGMPAVARQITIEILEAASS